MAIPLIAIAALAQAGLGAGQMVGASARRRRAERNFDEFEIPQGVMSMLDIAHGISSQREIPGADLYRDRAMGDKI